MQYFKKIIGEQLYLSPLCQNDAETFVKRLNDEAVAAQY
jgi:hypothetical protein